MIKGYCFTNLDEYRTVDWPTMFCTVPRIGERVEATSSRMSLRVVGVTHCLFDGEPRIRVELHR